MNIYTLNQRGKIWGFYVKHYLMNFFFWNFYFSNLKCFFLIQEFSKLSIYSWFVSPLQYSYSKVTWKDRISLFRKTLRSLILLMVSIFNSPKWKLFFWIYKSHNIIVWSWWDGKNNFFVLNKKILFSIYPLFLKYST